MTIDARHSKMTPTNGGVHVAYSYSYADETTRESATGFTSDDIGKIARQTDNGSFWVLSDDSPITWTELTSITTVASSVLLWGDDGIGTTTTIRYLSPGYDDGVAETTVSEFRMPMACTLQSLRVRHNTAGVGAATITYTLLVNGIASSLAVAMSNTIQDGSDLSNSVSISAGDLVGIRVEKSTSITTSPDNILVSLEVLA